MYSMDIADRETEDARTEALELDAFESAYPHMVVLGCVVCGDYTNGAGSICLDCQESWEVTPDAELRQKLV